MDTTPLDLSHLFEQLGLENGQSAIDNFIVCHKIKEQIHLTQADFWNDAQRAFLQESIEEDAQWSEVIDLLDTLLRK